MDLAYRLCVSLDHVVNGSSGGVRSEGRQTDLLAFLKDRIGARVHVDVLDRVVEFLELLIYGHNAVVLKSEDVSDCFDAFALFSLSWFIRFVEVLLVRCRLWRGFL